MLPVALLRQSFGKYSGEVVGVKSLLPSIPERWRLDALTESSSLRLDPLASSHSTRKSVEDLLLAVILSDPLRTL